MNHRESCGKRKRTGPCDGCAKSCDQQLAFTGDAALDPMEAARHVWSDRSVAFVSGVCCDDGWHQGMDRRPRADGCDGFGGACLCGELARAEFLPVGTALRFPAATLRG